jgi:GTP-binding protein HflX
MLKTARAVLVGLDLSSGKADERLAAGSKRALFWRVDDSLDELERLAATADVEVLRRFTQKMAAPQAATLIGSGKVEEIKAFVREEKLNLVIFDEELSPRQQANLEKAFNEKPKEEKGQNRRERDGAAEAQSECRVMDRTALILDIFALHATTREGKLQVELATLEYELPRLRGKWSHLEAEKLGGGVGARFGTGESQLETDRRLARKRISELKRELARVAQERAVQRRRRLASGVFRVALVGYTNAGKSTLLNALTQAEVVAYDKLFATLDSTTRRRSLATGREITLTDTVGFINKLPHGLVAAFKSTLDEVNEADLLLHVVDASASGREGQMQAVAEVLEELGAQERPILLVFNKMDALASPTEAEHEAKHLLARYPGSVLISAREQEGLDRLLEAIDEQALRSSESLEVLLPFARGDLVELAHKRAHILEERYLEEGTLLRLQVNKELFDRFQPSRH